MNAPNHNQRTPLTQEQVAAAILELVDSNVGTEATALRVRWLLEHDQTPDRDRLQEPGDIARKLKGYAADASEHASLMKIDRARKDAMKAIAMGFALVDRLDHEIAQRTAADEPQQPLPL